MSLLLLFGGTPLGGVNASLNQTLGALTLAGTGQVVVSGTLSQTLGALSLSGSASVGGSDNAALNAALAPLSLSGSAAVEVTGALDAVLAGLRLSAQASSGVQVPAPVKLLNESLVSAGSVNALSTPLAVTIFANGQPVAARSSALYTASFVDNLGKAVPLGTFTSLTLTLFDDSTGTTVVGNPGVNILNADRGILDALGNFSLSLGPADTAIIGAPLPAGRLQYRSIVLDWTYNGGQAAGRHQVNFAIVALAEA